MFSIYELSRLIVAVEDDDDILVSHGGGPFISISHVGSIANITFDISKGTVWETLLDGNVRWLDANAPNTWWAAIGKFYEYV